MGFLPALLELFSVIIPRFDISHHGFHLVDHSTFFALTSKNCSLSRNFHMPFTFTTAVVGVPNVGSIVTPLIIVLFWNRHHFTQLRTVHMLVTVMTRTNQRSHHALDAPTQIVPMHTMWHGAVTIGASSCILLVCHHSEAGFMEVHLSFLASATRHEVLVAVLEDHCHPWTAGRNRQFALPTL